MAATEPQTATRMTKNTPGAVKVDSGPSPIWYGRYKAADGFHRIALCSDKTASKQMLAKLVTDAKMAQLGMVDAFEEHSKRLLVKHLEDYRRHLEAKNNNPEHIAGVIAHCRAVFDGIEARTLSELDGDKISEWLSEKRRTTNMSISTSNHYTTSVKSFSKWLVKSVRTAHNVLVHLSRLNAEHRHSRPPQGFVHRGNPPTAASYPGEHESLSWSCGRRSVLPLWRRLSDRTQSRRTGKPVSGVVRVGHEPADDPTASCLREESQGSQSAVAARPGRGPPQLSGQQARRSNRMARHLVQGGMQDDCRRSCPGPPNMACRSTGCPPTCRKGAKRLSLVYRDSEGRTLDFHATRHTFISLLAKSGVHPKMAQSLARHSTITLTMDRYTHVGLFDQAHALESLPNMLPPSPESERQTLQATGTDPPRTAP